VLNVSDGSGGGQLPASGKVHSRVGSAVSFPQNDGQEMSMLNVSGSTAVSNFSPNRTVYLASSPEERGATGRRSPTVDDSLNDSRQHNSKGGDGGGGLPPVSLEEMLLEGEEGGTAAASPVPSRRDSDSGSGVGEGTVVVRPESGLGWTCSSITEDAEKRLDGMLQQVLARMELGEEERMIALERMRGDIASHNEHLEELTDLLSRHTDRIDELEKENKKVVAAMGGEASLASAATMAAKQSRAVVLKELPRNDQEVLMSNLSMEMALLLSKGLTKMGDLVSKQGTDRDGASATTKTTTTTSPGTAPSLRSAITAVTAANRLGGGLLGSGKLGSSSLSTAGKQQQTPTSTPATFEAEVNNRLTQLGW
jgi:hypothetical protein